MTADDPTWTVIIPLDGKLRDLPACCTPLTSGTGDPALVTCTQQGPEVAIEIVNFLVLTA